MITFITGLPGAGKTLFAIQKIQAMALKESRPVFYDGIKINPDSPLKAWLPLEGKSWIGLPSKSIILIDEAQKRYRPRGQGVAPPDEVKAMEEHRHEGYDIFLMTQHPMLIDSNVRRLAGAHFHLVRNFGLQRSTIHEWHSVKEQCDKSRTDSVRHEWNFPKQVYGWYTSAEAHTHKVRIPLRVWLLVLIPLILIPVGYKIFKWFYEASTGGKNEIYSGQVKKSDNAANAKAGNKARVVSSGVSSSGIYASQSDYFIAYKDIVEGVPSTKPVYQELAKPSIVPVITACLAIRQRCICYSQQSTRISVPEPLCNEIALHGVPFQDFKVAKLNEEVPREGVRNDPSASLDTRTEVDPTKPVLGASKPFFYR